MWSIASLFLCRRIICLLQGCNNPIEQDAAHAQQSEQADEVCGEWILRWDTEEAAGQTKKSYNRKTKVRCICSWVKSRISHHLAHFTYHDWNDDRLYSERPLWVGSSRWLV